MEGVVPHKDPTYIKTRSLYGATLHELGRKDDAFPILKEALALAE